MAFSHKLHIQNTRGSAPDAVRHHSSSAPDADRHHRGPWRQSRHRTIHSSNGNDWVKVSPKKNWAKGPSGGKGFAYSRNFQSQSSPPQKVATLMLLYVPDSVNMEPLKQALIVYQRNFHNKTPGNPEEFDPELAIVRKELRAVFNNALNSLLNPDTPQDELRFYLNFFNQLGTFAKRLKLDTLQFIIQNKHGSASAKFFKAKMYEKLTLESLSSSELLKWCQEHIPLYKKSINDQLDHFESIDWSKFQTSVNKWNFYHSKWYGISNASKVFAYISHMRVTSSNEASERSIVIDPVPVSKEADNSTDKLTVIVKKEGKRTTVLIQNSAGEHVDLSILPSIADGTLADTFCNPITNKPSKSKDQDTLWSMFLMHEIATSVEMEGYTRKDFNKDYRANKRKWWLSILNKELDAGEESVFLKSSLRENVTSYAEMLYNFKLEKDELQLIKDLFELPDVPNSSEEEDEEEENSSDEEEENSSDED